MVCYNLKSMSEVKKLSKVRINWKFKGDEVLNRKIIVPNYCNQIGITLDWGERSLKKK